MIRFNVFPDGKKRCVTFSYDDAGRLVSLTTYRNPDVVLSTDPGELTGDVTTWTYDPATGLELSKTYADNTSVVKIYDAHNRLGDALFTTRNFGEARKTYRVVAQSATDHRYYAQYQLAMVDGIDN